VKRGKINFEFEVTLKNVIRWRQCWNKISLFWWVVHYLCCE